MGIAFLNLLGNLYQILLTVLRFSPLYRNVEGCIQPIKGGDIRFCFTYPFFLVRFICRCICFIDNMVFSGFQLLIGLEFLFGWYPAIYMHYLVCFYICGSYMQGCNTPKGHHTQKFRVNIVN